MSVLNSRKPALEQTFEELRRAGIEPDRHWRAALRVLTSSPTLWEAAQPHIDLGFKDIDFESVRCDSESDWQMLSLAWVLFRGSGDVAVAELLEALSPAEWGCCLAALQDYRLWKPWPAPA